MTIPATPPEKIFLQCYDADGDLLDVYSDEVTWCPDQINTNDAVYVLEHNDDNDL